MNILIVASTENEIVKFDNPNVKFLITGVGIPNTIFNLTKNIIENSYDLIINIGICGSFNSKIKIGDVVEIVEDEFSEIGFENSDDFVKFDNEIKIESCFNVDKKTSLKSAKGITVNTIHGNEKSISEITKRLNPDVESMEGAACMMVAYKFNVPFIQIRGVSNFVEKRNKDNWNMPLSILNVNTELLKLISKL